MRFAKYYKNPKLGELEEPATVLDMDGRIMLWHLPHIFSLYRVVRLFSSSSFSNIEFSSQGDLNTATVALRRPLDSFMKSVDADTTVWRHSLFDPPPGGGLFGAGVLNFSPGWFQQSHDVSFPCQWFVVLFVYSCLVQATFRAVVCVF
jgi:hypothetical protein